MLINESKLKEFITKKKTNIELHLNDISTNLDQLNDRSYNSELQSDSINRQLTYLNNQLVTIEQKLEKIIFNLNINQNRFSATPIEDCKGSLYQLTIHLKNQNTMIFSSPTKFNFEIIYNWFYMSSHFNINAHIYLNESAYKTTIDLIRSNIDSMEIQEF